MSRLRIIALEAEGTDDDVNAALRGLVDGLTGPTRVTLNSPYGYLRAPGGGRIPNGTGGDVEGAFDPASSAAVLFDGERTPVKVPGFWLALA